ncbi:MAG: dTMP kinase [Clostridia bacterium]|nr:dTMP kinase [Clostridia bacterium]
MNRGLLITFEGIDGCGKSTQLNKLADWFKSNGRSVLVVREPGGTSIGEKIRNILLDKKNDEMCSVTELLLYEAARAQITSQVIRPAIEEGKIVICDRFYDSTFAYQGYARGLGEKLVRDLNETATEGLAPNITFLLDLTAEDAYKRRKGRGEAEDRLEAMGLDFQKAVREGYLVLAENDYRIRRIDASKSIDDIFETIVGEVEKEIAACGTR